MKKVVLTLVILAVAGVCFGASNVNWTKTYENDHGAVTFNHTIHAEYECTNCHLESMAIIAPNKQVGHKVCKVCHKKSGNENAPTKCKGCHKK